MLSRTTKLNGDEIEAFVDYLPEINLEVPEVDMNKVFSSASEIAIRIRMKTLDILHLSASVILNASNFVTFDNSFDSVICMWNAFSELAHDQDQVRVIGEIYRVLKKNGLRIISG